MKTTFPLLLATVALAPLSTAVLAETERQHGAHEHGAALLSLALDQHELVIALESPAFNVFGFEHAPSSDEQHQAVDAAVAALRDGEALWTLSRGAGCELESVDIDSAVLGEEHEHDDHDEDHGHEDDHDHDDDHGHEHESAGGHSDVDVSWHFHCDNPEQLTEVVVGLFAAFERFDDLDVQYLTDTAQGAAELSPSRTTLTLE